MRVDKGKERRHHERFALLLKAAAQVLPVYGARSTSSVSVRGKLRNISQGGAALVANRGLPVSALLECRVFLPALPVPIPTLVTVRWSRKRSSGGKYDIGLQYLV